ncbi:molybdenum cofactor biosynthesis protein MoaE [Pedomonas sp. V897]|uniref:molybdenum cofactor biosynthesis protein MoaE n=1 Tax=Pedomonas sp. V897 TaxID=3446482 RepID=UPI003EE2502A
MIEVRIQPHDFDVAAEIDRLRAGRTDIGALVTFTGLVRDMAGGQPIAAMTLEHYPAMALRQLETIAREAEGRWPLLGGTIIHRHGRLAPGDQIVLVAIASAHRHAAFEAAMFLMDWLKTKAPFWKKEEGGDGARWVAARAEDDAAAGRWLRET